jgi:hypothetical protein
LNAKTPYLIVLLVGLCLQLQGQGGFYLLNNARSADIPFEYVNNFIVLNLNFNGTLPLKFIFDTGAENTILSKREISDLLQIRYERTFKLMGSDLKTELTAFLARNIRLDIPNVAFAPREDILVLDEDYFRFEEYAGVSIHGILSGNAFSRYVVRINYQRRVITLFEKEGFRPKDAGYARVEMEVYRNKPYLNTSIQIASDTTIPVKLLIDTGAGLSMLLFSNTHALTKAPSGSIPSNIGMGLGGYLQGFTGRVRQLSLGTLRQQNIITYFQELDTVVLERDVVYARNGLIGNVILQRFVVMMDYQKGILWLKPNKTYETAFVYDRSGMHLIASGIGLHTFTVQEVLPGSPAAEAGIQAGDVLRRVGWLPASMCDLSHVIKKLQQKPGKKVRLGFKRGKKRFKTTIVLRELI